MKTALISIALVGAMSSSLAFAADDAKPMPTALESVSGLWLTAGKNGEVKISDCGDGTPCGVMTKVIMDDGSVALDGNNPDPELAGRPLVGVQMLHSFKEKSGRWKSGKIYNPENGKTYKSKIKRLDESTLEVKGCIGPICQSQIWTRITAE